MYVQADDTVCDVVDVVVWWLKAQMVQTPIVDAM